MRTIDSEWEMQEVAMRNARAAPPALAGEADFKRYTFIARVLVSQPDCFVPEDFAAKVAKCAEARAHPWEWDWSFCALIGGFVSMIAVCLVGWFQLGPSRLGHSESLADVSIGLASEPWLTCGIACVALIHALAFRRRAIT